MNNLVNGIIVLAVITALVLSIIALVQPCKSQFEDSGTSSGGHGVEIITNSKMETRGIRKLTNSDDTLPYGKYFINNGKVLSSSAMGITHESMVTSPDNPCNEDDICYFVKGPK